MLILIKKRRTLIIKNHLYKSQIGFRKGKGTRDAIFQLRMTCERSMEMNKNIYLCLIDYQTAVDRVRHEKLVEIVKKAGIPELGRRLTRLLRKDLKRRTALHTNFDLMLKLTLRIIRALI